VPPDVTPFHGKPEEFLGEFFQRVNMALLFYAGTPRQKYVFLYSHVRGAAQHALNILQSGSAEFPTYDQGREALEKLFPSDEARKILKKKMKERVQWPGESLREYFLAKRDLMARLEITDNVKQNMHILSGLSDEIRNPIFMGAWRCSGEKPGRWATVRILSDAPR
jgi:hypothetical protein